MAHGNGLTFLDSARALAKMKFQTLHSEIFREMENPDAMVLQILDQHDFYIRFMT